MKELMKSVLIVLLMVLAVGAEANYDCYRKVLSNLQYDSMAYQVDADLIEVAFEENSEAASKLSIRLLERDLGCLDKSFEIVEVSCNEIVPGNQISKVCYMESQHGYFFVSMDMMEKLNIVFSRWD